MRNKIKNINKARRIQDSIENSIRQYKEYRKFMLNELASVLNPEEFTGIMIVPTRIIQDMEYISNILDLCIDPKRRKERMKMSYKEWAEGGFN